LTGLLVVTPPGPESDTLCAALKELGFRVSTVGSGGEAVAFARQRQPAVILMDAGLSAMDRWHAVKRLNGDVATSSIPVLTLASGVGSPASLQRVVKKVRQILKGLEEATGHAEPPLAGPGTDGGHVEPPPIPSDVAATVDLDVARRGRDITDEGRILVVDDNALNRDMLSRRLQRRGYQVSVAESGEEALKAIRSQRFDLVLLDWMMPGLSGIDVLKQVRERFSAVELPIIMATAKTEAEDIVVALRLEANDYVTKPLNFDVVSARIRSHLGRAQAHRALVASERRYRALLENTGDMILQFRPSGELVYVSPASRTLLGVEPEDLIAHPLSHWLHPIDRRALERQQNAHLTLPPAYMFIARMLRRDESFTWVEVSCRVTRDALGQAMVLAACRDVSEHMERIDGDEPPLPLGGDIMTHPGWRGAPAGPSDPPLSAAPVVVISVVDGLRAEVLSGEAGPLVREVGERLLEALKGTDG
jgi:PAS domain S-box-containing protein